MKSLFVAVMAVAIVLAVAPSDACAANLLNNAGLESGTLGQFGTGSIDGWTTYGTSGWYHDDYNHTSGGARALKVWWDDAAAFQDVAVTGSTEYDFKAYTYSPLGGDQLTAGWNGVTKVEWYNGITKLSDNEIGRYLPGDTAGAWKPLSNSFTAPSSATSARVVMSLVNVNPEWTLPHNGSVTWDDLEVNAVPEPASLTLLGIGLAGLLGFRKKTTR